MSTMDDISHLHQNLHPAEGAGTGNGVMIPNLVPADLNATTVHSTTAGDNSSNGSSHSIDPTSSAVDNGPVQAYAKLESDTFCYYIRTLQVMLGRKAGSADEVDIHLGSTKGISRQHARLFYNFLNQRFELIVYGKNGAFVNEQFIEKGSTVPLEHRTKVQIGETTFHFLLPKMELEEATHENYPYLTGADEYHQEMKQTQQIPQAIPHQSSAAQSQTSSVQPHKQPEIRHNATAAAGNSNIGANSEFEQADGAQGTPREGETFDTSEYNNKDVKPPFSYASLIAQAINTSPNKKLTLNGIYNYITSHYPYYQMAQNGWQNSIRHNLSLNKAFIKVPRGDNEPGKGAFWTIDASCEGQFRNGVYRKSRRQPSGKVGGGTGPVRPKAGPSTSTPYTPPDPNRRRSTSSKSAAPAAGTPNSAKPVDRTDRPAGLGTVAGQMPTAKTTSLLGSVPSTAAYNTSTIPNASTAAAGATVPQVSTTYTPSSYITSNNTLPASNATTAATTLSPAMQLLTAAAALSSPALANLMTQKNATTPQLSATTVTSKPSSDGSTAHVIPVTSLSGSHATAVAPNHGVDAKTPP